MLSLAKGSRPSRRRRSRDIDTAERIPNISPRGATFKEKKNVAAPRALYTVRVARYGIQAGCSHARTRRTRGHKFASRVRRFCSLQSSRSLKLAFLHCEVRGTFLPWATSQGAVQRPSRAIFASLWLGIPLAAFVSSTGRAVNQPLAQFFLAVLV